MDTEPEASPPLETAPRTAAEGPAASPAVPRAIPVTEDMPPVAEGPAPSPADPAPTPAEPAATPAEAATPAALAPTPTATEAMPPVEETAPQPVSVEVDLAAPDDEPPRAAPPESDIAVPDKLASDIAVPDKLASDIATPDKLASDIAVPDKSASDIAAPDKPASDIAAPEKRAVSPASDIEAPGKPAPDTAAPGKPTSDSPSPAASPPIPPKPDAAPEPVPPSVRPRRRRWLTGLAVFFGLLVAAAIALVVLGPGYVRGRILDEALARGVVLAFGDMDVSLSQIRLHDVRIGLSGVRDFEASAGFVEVAIADGQPRSIVAGQLAISMTGTDVLGALGTWKNEHAAALAAPLSAEDAHLEWHPAAGTAPALVLEGARLSVDLQKGLIDATSARFNGRDAGPVELAWTSPPEGFVVTLKPRSAPLSAAHIEVRSTKDGARLKLTLDRTPLGPLQSALGIPKGSEGLQADGEVEMPVPSLAHPTAVDGTLRLSVKGYTPPHPRELDGILFGDTTTVKSKFQLAPDLGSAKLTGITAEAGALSLTGSGDLVREGLDARVTLKLKGSIPCTSLATSVAMARLGSGLGRLAGGLAAGALQGSVTVSISVDAKASDVKGAKITQSAGIGCKVAIPGLPTIILR